jgi:hypothetical protein
MNNSRTKTSAEWLGIEDQARLVAVRVGIWNDNGYPEPLPFEGAHPIPPLGERSADNIKAGHGAIEAIDETVRDLYRLREQLVGELRTDEDVRNARVDAVLAEARANREAEQAARAPQAEGTARLGDSPGLRHLLAHQLGEGEAEAGQ